MSESKLTEWDEEMLILYFYGELDMETRNQIEKSLNESKELEREYRLLTNLLEKTKESKIPPASENFEQNIMAAIHREIEKVHSEEAAQKVKHVKEPVKSAWASLLPRLNILAGSALTIMLMVGVFYIGRWSGGPATPIQVTDSQTQSHQEVTSSSTSNSNVAATRVLMKNLSDHLENGERLFTLVSNGNGDLANQIEQRRQSVDELVSLNRLYRRVAEKRGDRQLVNLLQQMETILMELNNNVDKTEQQSEPETIKQVKQRLEQTDLLFKLRVTNKKVSKKII